MRHTICLTWATGLWGSAVPKSSHPKKSASRARAGRAFGGSGGRTPQVSQTICLTWATGLWGSGVPRSSHPKKSASCARWTRFWRVPGADPPSEPNQLPHLGHRSMELPCGEGILRGQGPGPELKSAIVSHLWTSPSRAGKKNSRDTSMRRPIIAFGFARLGGTTVCAHRRDFLWGVRCSVCGVSTRSPPSEAPAAGHTAASLRQECRPARGSRPNKLSRACRHCPATASQSQPHS